MALLRFATIIVHCLLRIHLEMIRTERERKKKKRAHLSSHLDLFRKQFQSAMTIEQYDPKFTDRNRYRPVTKTNCAIFESNEQIVTTMHALIIVSVFFSFF